MALQVLEPTGATATEEPKASVEFSVKADPKSIKDPKKAHTIGEASTTAIESEKENKNIQKIQKSTWKKVKDWFTRAYRISKVAEKRPEKVKSVGKHIILLGMLVGVIPAVLSGISKSSPTQKKPGQKNTPQQILKKKSSTSDSQRLRLTKKESKKTESPPEEPKPVTQDIGNQVLAIITNEEGSSEDILTTANFITTEPSVFTNDSSPITQSVSEEISTTVFHTESANTEGLQIVKETDINMSKVSEVNTFNKSLETETDTDIQLSLWSQEKISFSFSSETGTRNLDLVLGTLPGEFSLGNVNKRINLNDPNLDLIRNLTYEHQDELPLEIAYEMAMKILVNGFSKVKSLRFTEEEFDMREVEEEKTTVSLETGIDNIFSGAKAKLQLSLKKIQVKAEVDIAVPWEDGDLEFEAFAKIKPFERMPLDKLRFQLNYKHPVLGGMVELRGYLDFEPNQQNPYTCGARVRFQTMIYKNAYLGGQLTCVKQFEGPQSLGLSFGFEFTWGPGAKEIQENPYEGMSDDEAHIREKFAAEEILTKMALQAQKRSPED